MRLLEPIVSIAAPAIAAWCLAACGGSFEGDDDDGGGSSGQAGSAGKGGMTSGGRGGSGGTSGTGASSGSGGAGGGCEWMGNTYAVGDTFPAGDGCNTCSCGPGGSVGCTEAVCDECSELQSAYEAAIWEAGTCEPGAPDACTEAVFVGLVCGCESFLNPEHADAIQLAEQLRSDYNTLSCAGDVACSPCLPPTGAFCSAEGLCVNTYDMPAATACKVNGVVYQSGSTNVPDPFSCNTCDCFEGQLACTEINCPVACPPDTTPSSQCAQCGPADGCEVVEHACLPTCVDTCASGVCVDSICRNLCG